MLWLNIEFGDHPAEPCGDFVAHLHLPFGWVMWA